MPGSFCKLCLDAYKTTKDPRNTITDDFIGRLDRCGIKFTNNAALQDTTTVCRNCFNGLKHIEKGDPFKYKWRNSTSQKRRHVDLVDNEQDNVENQQV